MKKIFTLLSVVLFCGTLMAQSTRLTLFEEVTGENCGPCAATNPGLNALLNANATKVVSIKYQAPHGGPSAGPYPLYAANKTDVNARRTFYNNTSAPDGYYDGGIPFKGHPGNFTQAMIDNRSAVVSPFSINVTHTISADGDSVYITAIITASDTVSGNMKAHIVVVERNIYFETPPGTNGEKHFEGVMKKMLPSASGTTLDTAWLPGDDDTLTQSWKFANVYDFNEVAVVAFIQDNTTKEVHQAAFSAPQAMADHAGVSKVTSPGSIQCVNDVDPVIEIKNRGTSTLTSATVNYKIDNGTVNTVAWTGSLASGATATFAIPTVTVAAGSHLLTSYITAPNGVTYSYTPLHDSKAKRFTISDTALKAVAEGYENAAFPPTGWVVDNPDGGVTWKKAAPGGFKTSTYSAKLDFFNSPTGQIDELFVPLDLGLLNSTYDFSFNVAYAPYNSTYHDQLDIAASTDCGVTWTTLYSKANNDLKTANATTSAFTPTATQWRKDSISLTQFAGQQEVLIKFKGISGFGNNLYIDDVTLNRVTTSIKESSTNLLSLYPNPSNGLFNLSLELPKAKDITVTITDILGKDVYQKKEQSAASLKTQIDLGAQPAGVYFVRINAGGEQITKKIILN